MTKLLANGISIECETAGDPKGTPVLLIMGLGMQLTSWPDDFVDGLVELGFFVIRFDNRDSGLSTKFDDAGKPNLALSYLKHLFGWRLKSAYSLEDMARDAVGVLDAFGVRNAHVVGASMGGMIAQVMASGHPERVLSLTSIMSSSGRRGLPGPSREARAMLMRRPRNPKDFDSVVDHMVQTFRVIGSPAYPTPEKVMRERMASQLRRNACPDGVLRQMVAIVTSGDRSALLASIRTPTLVIHGAADPLVPLACGVDTAKLVPGARLEVIEGMGHDLPAQLIERLIALIDAHAHGKMPADSTSQHYEKQ
jgi:pimeloyl-ACP methyl ester carboxylesterase